MTKQELKSEIVSLLKIEDTVILKNIIHKYNSILNKNTQSINNLQFVCGKKK